MERVKTRPRRAWERWRLATPIRWSGDGPAARRNARSPTVIAREVGDHHRGSPRGGTAEEEDDASQEEEKADASEEEDEEADALEEDEDEEADASEA